MDQEIAHLLHHSHPMKLTDGVSDQWSQWLTDYGDE